MCKLRAHVDSVLFCVFYSEVFFPHFFDSRIIFHVVLAILEHLLRLQQHCW